MIPQYAGLDPFTVTVTDDLDGGATEQIISIMVTGTGHGWRYNL